MSAQKGLLRLVNAARLGWLRVCGCLFPVKRGKTVFSSFGGATYSDNPRAVSEALCAMSPGHELVWMMTRPEEKRGVLPDCVKVVRIHSPRAIYHMATAGAWVLNGTVAPYVRKRKNQRYIQTWHGDRGFKVCLHVSGKDGLPDSDMIDLAVSGSAHAEMFYREAFRYRGAFLRVGSPRNDRLMGKADDSAHAVRRALGLPEGERIVLYAPTMRDSALKDDGYLDAGAIDFQALLRALSERDRAPWRLLVRAHVRVKGIRGVAKDPRVTDVSAYEDMRDLLLISDLLITDYSSCAGDFPLTGKPVILFQNDRAAFLKDDRSLYFDVADSPFCVAEDDAALRALALSLTGSCAAENDRAILKFFGAYETGEAAIRVAEAILR